MTKAAAIRAFLNSAIPGVKFYPSTAVPSKADGDPEDAVFPYGTYDFALSAFGEGEEFITVNLWFYTRDELPANAAAQTLSEAIGRGGTMIPCDTGYVWLKRGSPFAQPVQEEDNSLKRRYINITAEYLTPN